MIKYPLYILLIFLLSCVDLITNIDYYESIYFQGSGWIEFYGENLEDKLILDSDFSVQLWFSGVGTSEEAPCILNIQDENFDLAIYRDLNIPNNLRIYLNQNPLELLKECSDTQFDNQEDCENDEAIWGEIELLSFDTEEIFHLLSVTINDSSLNIYINDKMIITEEDIEIVSPEIIIGGDINKIEDEFGNYWYGYIDEIRLWDIALSEEIITFHSEYTDKISSSYEDEYLESLLGLWDFQIEVDTEIIPYIFQDIYENQIHTIIYTLESEETELSELGR